MARKEALPTVFVDSNILIAALMAPASPAGVLNLVDRSFEYFGPDHVSRLAGHLASFDVLIGLHVRDVVIGLGQSADKWTLVDLQPPQKRLKLNQRGRTLKITPELLIAGTTGISRPLAAPAKIAEYLATGDMKKRARRLESDAKALYAFYRYGVLHGCVRLRWGFKDETFGVEWTLPSDVKLNAVLESSVDTGAAIEIVMGTAPGWGDPWSRAQRGRVIKFLPVWHPVVFSGEAADEYVRGPESSRETSAAMNSLANVRYPSLPGRYRYGNRTQPVMRVSRHGRLSYYGFLLSSPGGTRTLLREKTKRFNKSRRQRKHQAIRSLL